MLDETIQSEECKRNFAKVIDEVSNTPQRLTITRRHVPIAALVPLQDLKLLQRLDQLTVPQRDELLRVIKTR